MVGEEVMASEVLITKDNKFRDLKTGLNNVISRIIQGHLYKDNGLERTSNVLSALEEAVDQFIAFYGIKPDESEYKGLQIMFGDNCVKNRLDEIYVPEPIDSVSIVSNLIKQIDELKKKMLNLSTMTEDTISYENVVQLGPGLKSKTKALDQSRTLNSLWIHHHHPPTTHQPPTTYRKLFEGF